MQETEAAVLVLAAIIVAVFLVIWLVSALKMKKAVVVCRGIISSNLDELRMLDECWLTTGFFPDKGILALLADRMVFISVLFNKRLEIPLAEVTGLRRPKFALPVRSGLRVLWVRFGRRWLKLSLDQFVLAAWEIALKKASPQLATTRAFQ